MSSVAPPHNTACSPNKIGFGLLAERRREHAAARAADAVRVGEGTSLRFAGRILRHGDQARHASALLVLPTHEIAGPLRRDQHDVEVGARLDQLVLNVEAVREQQSRVLLQVRFDVLIQLRLRHVGREERNEPDAFDGLGRRFDREAVALRFRRRLAIRT